MKIPDGYKLVEDANYIVKAEDLYYFSSWGRMPAESVGTLWQSSIGRSYISLFNEYCYDKIKLYILTKGIIKPRFPNTKEYPHGY